MSDDLYGYNRETRAEALARRERAQIVNSGERGGKDGLTTGERELLAKLLMQAIAIAPGQRPAKQRREPRGEPSESE